MRSSRFLWAALALGSCVSIHNPDATPGQIVFAHGPFGELASWIQGGPPGATLSYRRVLVIAPPGAVECAAGLGAGPLRRGVPDASRRVLLDLPDDRDRVRVRCDTENGRVVREVEAIVVGRLRRRYGRGAGRDMTIESYPPIVHVGELDAEAPERWRRFHQEACTGELRSAEFMSICNDESFAALRRADIGS